MKKNIFQVQPQFCDRENWTAFSIRERLYFEPLEFFLPPANGDSAYYERIKDWYRESGRVKSLHGAFIDVNPASGDPAFRDLSRRRCHESCRLAKELGAQQVVLHASAFPFLRGVYLDNWADQCAAFYMELAESYHLGIRVENGQDVDTAPLKALMQRVRDADVSVCLDIGHAHYSLAPLEKWFEDLGDYISYLHLSDNMGHFDDHLPVGKGTVNWKTADSLWKQTNRGMPVTLEVGGIAGVEESLKYMRINGYFGIEG